MGSIWEVSRSKKWDFLLKMLCVYIWKYACHSSEKHVFRKIMKKKWSESEKWSRKTLDGKCDGYACAVLVTCKSMKIENVLRTLGRKHFFEGDKFGVYLRFGFL